MKKDTKSNLLVILLFIFSILIFSFSIWYFNREEAPYNQIGDGKIKAVATIFPIYDIMRQVGGERIDSTLLLPPGASPHNFEPSPKNVEDLDKTNFFLFAGAGMDFWANDIVKDNINQSR